MELDNIPLLMDTLIKFPDVQIALEPEELTIKITNVLMDFEVFIMATYLAQMEFNHETA